MDEQPPPSKKPHLEVIGASGSRSSPTLEPSIINYKDKEANSALMVFCFLPGKVNQQVSIPAMLFVPVAKETEGRLATNAASLLAVSSLSVQGTVQSPINSPPGLGARQKVKSFLSGWWRVTRSRRGPGGDLGLAQAILSFRSSINKHSRPPKDAPWRIK
ncbi:hypothetical protein E2C01_047387 [Portunus trituberculatus]|uniref:Uncharacterized protein n=1 Tax=Portunus trituberculatus TaxID=210409 RepID=A0A5B7G8E0_PORTR|nr:hypothetical protein [Portunus trituberculatus]